MAADLFAVITGAQVATSFKAYGETSPVKVLAAHQNETENKAWSNSSGNGVECWYCCETGHVKLDCFKRKWNKSKDDGIEKDMKEKALVTATKKEKHPAKLAFTPSHRAFIDLGAFVHMMKAVSVITGKGVPLNTSIGTAGKDTIKSAAQSESVIRLSDQEKPVILSRILYVTDVEHGLVSVSSL